MRSLELFVGAGGLSLGLSAAGFEHGAVIDKDPAASRTIRENQRRGLAPVVHWPFVEGDVREFDYTQFIDRVDLLAGGPPCQPFSLGGKHRAHLDERDMFPEVVRAVRKVRPRAVVIENVRGLVRPAFAEYFKYILLQLRHPEAETKVGESWNEHAGRLQKHDRCPSASDLSYTVEFRVVNAASYGVPQIRQRVFIVCLRCDINAIWSFPQESHSQDALLWDQWVSGTYWDRHCFPRGERPDVPAGVQGRVERLRRELIPPSAKPWLTVRDAIGDLPSPASTARDEVVANHVFYPGARCYPGHTGSRLDVPAKTLKAGDHGVAGGENTLAIGDNVRYFTIRECARVQTFPDEYVFPGHWTETVRQLGNAVPVRLAHVIGNRVRVLLQSERMSSAAAVEPESA